MEDAEHKDAQLALRAFNSCLAAGIEALKDSGRWKSILEAGGSPKEMLGRPSPHVQVRHSSHNLPLASLRKPCKARHQGVDQQTVALYISACLVLSFCGVAGTPGRQ